MTNNIFGVKSGTGLEQRVREFYNMRMYFLCKLLKEPIWIFIILGLKYIKMNRYKKRK